MLYRFFYFLVKLIVVPLYRVKVHGIENIPKEENFILCANHENLLDPIFIASAIDRQINFLAKKELFEIPILKNILRHLNVMPVDRDGKDLNVLRSSIQVLKKGEILGVFPEGTRVKEIRRDNVKDGAGFIALKSKKNILAIEIISSYKPFRKTDLYVKEIIDIDKYNDIKSKEAMIKIMDDTFEKMYEEHNKIKAVR